MKWIKFTDKQPEIGKRILIFIGHEVKIAFLWIDSRSEKNRLIKEIIFDSGDCGCKEFGRSIDLLQHKIYWMPLPEKDILNDI